MATLNMENIIAVMPEADTLITLPDGTTFNAPAQVPFTTDQGSFEATGKFALMKTIRSVSVKGHIQCFNFSTVVTLA